MPSRIRGTLLGNRVSAFWHDGERNFGDLLAPRLLRAYGLTPVYRRAARAEVVLMGSILERVPQDYPGYILGSGLMCDRVRHFDRAAFLAVRGEFTRQRTGAPGDVALGDPGLLSPRLLADRPGVSVTLGLVPHYEDQDDPRIEEYGRRFGADVAVINVRRKPESVLADIARCRFVISSSLHGLVAADALGLSSAWMLLSGKVRGEGFKFRDHYSALGIQPQPLGLAGTEELSYLTGLCRNSSGRVAELQEGLDQAFCRFRDAVLSG